MTYLSDVEERARDLARRIGINGYEIKYDFASMNFELYECNRYGQDVLIASAPVFETIENNPVMSGAVIPRPS